MSGLSFDPDAIRALAVILRDSDLTEIELVEKDSRIRVAREVTSISMPAQPALVAVPSVASPIGSAATVVTRGEEAPHPGAVTSPMVGVAYLSPEPGAAPFVVQGQAVAAGQTLLLIEAMKTFNQIKAPKAGTLTRVLVDTGMPVEYGEPLMVIE